ncbi:MAG TPA: hypothetical protein VLR50_18195, partial [Desulfobacterales bacterium]|nr:hypothetical protein [Desulfobacterales bacterium]
MTAEKWPGFTSNAVLTGHYCRFIDIPHRNFRCTPTAKSRLGMPFISAKNESGIMAVSVFFRPAGAGDYL